MANFVPPEERTLLGWGDLSHVFQLSDSVAIKCSTSKGDPRFENENRVFDQLERHPPCPCIVNSFFRVPDMNFMEYLPGRNLETLLRSRQKIDPKTYQVLEVYAALPEDLVTRWMKELASAASWLESLQLAHGDIRPANILLDAHDHLRLVDFDHTMPVGEEVEAGMPPYARPLGDEAGSRWGSFGFLGPRTEHFAVGSVFYYLTRGYEPYDNEWYGPDHGPSLSTYPDDEKNRDTENRDVSDDDGSSCVWRDVQSQAWEPLRLPKQDFQRR